MHAKTATGQAWRCLRCGSYVTGEPHSAGPAADAPVVRRGKEIRGDLILRLFAIERFFRFLLFAAIAYGIWRFAHSRLTITEAFNRELPIVRSVARQLGLNIDQTGVVALIRRVLHISQSRLTLIAAGVSGVAVISFVEGIGLWLARRWGEYFAMVATSLFLPLEVYELSDKFTVTKLLLFLLNIVLVLYLVINRRLFGVRGGKEAYEARLASESVMDEAAKIAASLRPPAGPADGAVLQPAATGQQPASTGQQPAGRPAMTESGMPAPSPLASTLTDEASQPTIPYTGASGGLEGAASLGLGTESAVPPASSG
jgi:uncharacterized membrane protein (DUF2068 family)